MILSADDFGISPSVSQGILELIEQGRISSTSCMISSKTPHEQIQALKGFRDRLDVGLHLVLTQGRPASPQRPLTLTDDDGYFLDFEHFFRRSYFGFVDGNEVYRELRAQLSCFLISFGALPDFIDGHQHVQQLPVVRNALARVMQEFPKIKYARVAEVPQRWLLKMALRGSLRFSYENYLIAWPGRRTRVLLDKCQIRHNRYLLGYYDHQSNVSFEEIFRCYLEANPGEKDVFFCHPGYVDQSLREVDDLVEARLDNLAFLKSHKFLDICGQNGIEICRFEFEKESSG